MHLVFEGTVIFRTKDDTLEIGSETFPLSRCRLDWLDAFSGRLTSAPINAVVIEAEWLRRLNYTAPERLVHEYIKPYQKFAALLGHDRYITRADNEKKTESVGSILEQCRCI
jgi:hypothetical protein